MRTVYCMLRTIWNSPNLNEVEHELNARLCVDTGVIETIILPQELAVEMMLKGFRCRAIEAQFQVADVKFKAWLVLNGRELCKLQFEILKTVHQVIEDAHNKQGGNNPSKETKP